MFEGEGARKLRLLHTLNFLQKAGKGREILLQIKKQATIEQIKQQFTPRPPEMPKGYKELLTNGGSQKTGPAPKISCFKCTLHAIPGRRNSSAGEELVKMSPRVLECAKPRFRVGELVRVNNGVRASGVVRSVCKRPGEGYEALVEVSGEPLFRKAVFWVPESELTEAT